ncbi:hypothetical protein EDD16DRAFT_1893818 [Pisolithus croceorrhizus]|nr:hypothetical protein EDD16DRAFT_1893818 [Pisolithus croceorrhizus]
MSQHSALQPGPGPSAGQIEPQSSLEEQWEKANATIHEMVKVIQSTDIEHCELLVQTLVQIQLYSLPKVFLKVTMDHDVYMDLIEDNPDLRQALESAIESGCYDQDMSLHRQFGGRDDDTGDKEESTGNEGESTEDEEEITGHEITTTGAEYHGNYHEVMLRNINSMKHGRIYTPFAEITQSSGTGKSRTVHTLSYFQTSSVFTLFLSTQSSMGHFTSSTQMTWLAQQLNTNDLQAPFMEMPFDCHPTFLLKPGDFNLEQLQDLAFLVHFGRPLFWSLIEASMGADKPEFAEKIMALACAKLIHSSDIRAEQSDLAMLATLVVLITIDYELRLDLAHKCEMDMIATPT